MTDRHRDAIGMTAGWRCLEVGAGGGSVARRLGERVGATGSVLALDLDTTYLADLPPHITVRRHDLTREQLPHGEFDLVHCRALLMHLPDPAATIASLAATVAPGGWLLVEEGDFGLAGSPDAAAATTTWHTMWSHPGAAQVADAYFGRRVPGMVDALGWDRLGTACDTETTHRGDPA
jgi:ubiquinone/menaquinone biosynthesis C-methylase UbiE